MKIFYLNIIAILCIMNTGFSQDLLNSQTLVTSNTGLIYEIDRSDKTIQGSPYIEEVFLPARVTADIEQIFNARYNAVTDEVEVETEKSTIQAINKLLPGITVTFLKNNKIYNGMTYFNEDGQSVKGYLIPLTNDNANVKLFLKEKIVYTESKPAKSSYQEAVPAKFDRLDDSYYLIIDREIAKPLSKNKKEIAGLFPNQEKQILNYISSEKLNIKKKEDLMKLIAHINQSK